MVNLNRQEDIIFSILLGSCKFSSSINRKCLLYCLIGKSQSSLSNQSPQSELISDKGSLILVFYLKTVLICISRTISHFRTCILRWVSRWMDGWIKMAGTKPHSQMYQAHIILIILMEYSLFCILKLFPFLVPNSTAMQ